MSRAGSEKLLRLVRKQNSCSLESQAHLRQTFVTWRCEHSAKWSRSLHHGRSLGLEWTRKKVQYSMRNTEWNALDTNLRARPLSRTSRTCQYFGRDQQAFLGKRLRLREYIQKIVVWRVFVQQVGFEADFWGKFATWISICVAAEQSLVPKFQPDWVQTLPHRVQFSVFRFRT